MDKNILTNTKYFQAFSVFFICIALTSDMICFLFIPVHWLFFAASTYVWVQYVWHTGAWYSPETSNSKKQQFFFITACHAVQVQSSISMSSWAKICHWAISHKWYNTITFIRHYWQYLLFREGNMSANSVPLAPLCLHRGCGQAEGIQVPFWHQEPSISSWPVQTLRSALVSTRSILRTTLPASVIPVSCVLELQTIHWFSRSC